MATPTASEPVTRARIARSSAYAVMGFLAASAAALIAFVVIPGA